MCCNLVSEKQSKDVHLSNNNKNVMCLLNDELRSELKKPQGLLITGTIKTTMRKLKELIKKEKISTIISVGDVVSKNILEYGLPLNILIIDNKSMRKPIQPIIVDSDQTFYAKNPPGTITEEACTAIKRANKSEGLTKVMISGEEDLLTIVAVLYAPQDAFVIYGQPHEGIVIVKVTEEKRKNMRQIFDLMKKTSKS